MNWISTAQLRSGRLSRRAALALLPFVLLNMCAFSGCTMLTEFLTHGTTPPVSFEEIERHRRSYLTERSSESLRWLITHQIANGMTKADVDGAIGESGERVFADAKVLAQDGLFRSDDMVYRWGPDSDGNVYMFVFRDNHLVNFENFNDELTSARGPRFSLSLSSDDL